MSRASIPYGANWLAGAAAGAAAGATFEKIAPASGRALGSAPRSGRQDVDCALAAAAQAFPGWSGFTPVRRGQILDSVVQTMKAKAAELAKVVAAETGKSIKDATVEVGAAIQQGQFFAAEGMRLYARSLTSGMPGKYSHSVRAPLGICALIVPANTPIANIAWKVFPALICGNTAVLKASEDAPETASLFASLAHDAGLPAGVLNVVQGYGQECGSLLVEDERVAVISFTGSTPVGRWIAEVGGRRLARVSLELGGKNPLVVCDDADIDEAVKWAALSAFSNAGQRCAAGSRLIVFDAIYDAFMSKLVQKTKSLKLGVADSDDLGPVQNQRQMDNILRTVAEAASRGGRVLCGGRRAGGGALANGFYVEPTVVEIDSEADPIGRTEMFGPVVSVHRVKDYAMALQIANATEYGLTAAIHTTSTDRAQHFCHHVRAGVVNVNIGTYGSEPHMPFGGFGASGNGTREPGSEALDVYSELKNISFFVRDGRL